MSVPDRDAANERLNLLLSLRRYADAERFAREAVGWDPDWGDGYTHLARALFWQGRYPEAIEAARVGVAKSPGAPWPLVFLGLVQGVAGTPADGLDAVTDALRADPTYSWAHSVRSQLLYRLGRWEDSLAASLAGLELDPWDETLLFRKGWAELELGRLTEAAASAQAALRAHPTSAMVVNLNGVVALRAAAADSWLGRRKHLQAAERYFAEAVRLEPSEAAYQQNLRLAAVNRHRLPTILAIAVWYAFSIAAVVSIGFYNQLDCCGCGCGTIGLLWVCQVALAAAGHSVPMVLTGPVVWLGSRTPPLEPAERRAGRRAWWLVLLSGVVPALAAASAILVRS